MGRSRRPDTTEQDKRNAEVRTKEKRQKRANKEAQDRAAERKFKRNRGRRSLITTGEEGLPDNLG